MKISYTIKHHLPSSYCYRFYLSTLLGLVFFIASSSSYATGVGFVNISTVMQEAPQSVAAVKRLEQEFAKKDEDLLELEDDIRKGESLLRRSVRSMDSQQRERLQNRIISMKREFKESREEFREEFSKRRAEELKKIQVMVQNIIADLAKSKNLDLIVAEPVLYADDKINLTEQVLSILEERAK